jgi:hypothetical protein
LFGEDRFSRASGLANGESPLPLVFDGGEGFWSDWQLALKLSGTETNARPDGRLLGKDGFQADLQLAGTIRDPRLIGEVTLQGGPLRIGGQMLMLESVRFDFREDFPRDPSIFGSASGIACGESFEMLVTGTTRYPMRVVTFAPPLTEKIVLKNLLGTSSDDSPAHFGFLVSAELLEGVLVTDWPAIPTPATPEPVAPPAPAPPEQNQ